MQQAFNNSLGAGGGAGVDTLYGLTPCNGYTAIRKVWEPQFSSYTGNEVETMRVVGGMRGRFGSDWAWLAVADQGPGLSDDISQVIGLGLSIVFGVAEGHGGTVGSYPNPGGGTVMVVWIPLTEHPGSPPRTSPLEGAPT